MLAYLDSLIAAMTVRDTTDIERLLAHPLARILPQDARREAETFRDAECDPLAAPLRVMQLRYQTAELLALGDPLPDRAPAVPARVALSAPPRPRQRTQAQMELPLSA
jgi:hypothetical protein